MGTTKTIALHANWLAELRAPRQHSLSIGDEVEVDFGQGKLPAKVTKLLRNNRVKIETADGRCYSAPGDRLRISLRQVCLELAGRFADA